MTSPTDAMKKNLQSDYKVEAARLIEALARPDIMPSDLQVYVERVQNLEKTAKQWNVPLHI